MAEFVYRPIEGLDAKVLGLVPKDTQTIIQERLKPIIKTVQDDEKSDIVKLQERVSHNA